MNIIEILRNQDRNAFFNSPNVKHHKRSNQANSRLLLDKYQGVWDKETVKHLLNRTLFGYGKYSLEEFVDRGLDASLDQLLNYTSHVEPPVNNYAHVITDPNVQEGETWVNDGYSENGDLTSNRVASLKAWWMKRILKQEDTIEEKMTLFWHNLLVTQFWGVFFPSFSYEYLSVCRDNALGDFRTMITQMTHNGAMLIYLNGISNNVYAPNENYSRELQELFTVGKGPSSNYTETDVQEAARILTGWTLDWGNTYDIVYYPDFHDQGEKTFSSFYGNRTISGGTTEAEARAEVDELIDMILSTDECSKYIARRIYQFFVYPIIDEWTENNIINDLAQTIKDNNYEIKPAVRNLLESQHFYDHVNRAAMVKTPLELFTSLTKSTGIDFRGVDPRNPRSMEISTESVQDYGTYLSLHYHASNSGMEIGDPPGVAGWPPTYQNPNFDYLWMNSNTIKIRLNQVQAIVGYGIWRGDGAGGELDYIPTSDWTEFFIQFDNPSDPDDLIDELIDNLITYPENRVELATRMKASLLGAQGNYNWTAAWYDFIDNPNDATIKETVNSRLLGLMYRFLNLPDFQLS